MKDLSLGIKSFFEGLGYFRRISVIRNLSMIPIFLCILLLTLGMGLVIFYIDDFLNAVAFEWMANLNVYLKSIIYILSSMLLFIVVYFIVLITVSILTIPICDKLTSKVFELKNPALLKSKNESSNFFKMLKSSLIKLGFVAVISVFILLATFLPALYPVVMYITFMLVTWDVLDFSFDIEQKTFNERVQFIQQNWLVLTGFALCLGVLLFIPFIHFILLPVAVTGAACMYLNIQAQNTK